MSHSQPRPFHMLGGGGHNAGGKLMHNVSIFDTTYTKLFVGGLAWETQRDTMRHYFEQFGEIQEAVVITDKNTGRSKGYGFVTFKDPDAAMRACQNPSPVIDGRRANCNLASLGAQKPHHPPVPHHEIENTGGAGRFRSGSALVGPSAAYHGSSSTYFHQPAGQYTVPYSAYGYSGYSHDTMYPMNYYSMYGGQQYSPYYTAGALGQTGIYANYYPYYPQYSHNSQGQGLGVHYPQVLHYPYLPQRNSASGILSLPGPSALATTTSDATLVAGRTQNAGSVTVMGGVVGTVAAAASQTTKPPEQSSSN